MTSVAPLGHDEWPALAKVAARLLADRAQALPADNPRVLQMRSVVAIWRAVIDITPIDRASADWTAIRADLADAATRAAAQARRLGDDERAHQTALAVAAIAWHFRPVSDAVDTPMLVFCHDATLALQANARAAIAARQAAPAASFQPRPPRPAGDLFAAAA